MSFRKMLKVVCIVSFEFHDAKGAHKRDFPDQAIEGKRYMVPNADPILLLLSNLGLEHFPKHTIYESEILLDTWNAQGI
jgi:hypothetical protein